jgi:hypothetical protein
MAVSTDTPAESGVGPNEALSVCSPDTSQRPHEDEPEEPEHGSARLLRPAQPLPPGIHGQGRLPGGLREHVRVQQDVPVRPELPLRH